MTILAFGEVLIDGLSSGDVPVGAPMNVAVHAARLGGTPAAILTRWHLDWLCITHGSGGASFHTPSDSWQVPAVPVQVVDTAGAGDAFLAGLLVNLGNGLQPAEALAAGAREGARIAGQRSAV